ncbi:tryptophanase [Thermogladius sp. KZ2Tp1]|uniref:tryptophanase n=1 Tax=Thermogladius sp. KZ2Tp1 TaxID=3136289 RepID=UPI003DAA09F6
MRVEGFRVRVVERIRLPSLEERLLAIREAGFNTFLLKADDVFLDMLTDSGVNAMTVEQLAGMVSAQDAYAGSNTYEELARAVEEVLGFKYTLPVHQGRAAEHLVAKTLVRPGSFVVTNFHFTTTRAHVELAGGALVELPIPEALDTSSEHPFKGNMDAARLEEFLARNRERTAFVRVEALANLLGGQPVSMENIKLVKEICERYGVPLVVDGSMIDWNSYFVKERELGSWPLGKIIKEFASHADVFYMSARKAGSVRGGLLATNNREFYEKIAVLLPVFEGFLSYGGMSVKEIAALAVGLRQLAEEELIGSEIELIKNGVRELDRAGVPVVKPPGGLGIHVDALKFLENVPRNRYPAGALTTAFYIASGIRGMERGAISNDRLPDGREEYPALELMRLAFPRKTYLRNHVEYLVDRLVWLYENRDVVKGLEWVYEPPVLRFFLGRLRDVGNWSQTLADNYRREFGEQ